MTNKRVFYAIKAVGLAPESTENYVSVHGLQSVGITTNFNLEQVFEIGQLAIYENIEGIPDIEVTLNKVLDGYPLVYHLATRGYPANTLIGRSNQKTNMTMSIFGDTQNSASGVPVAQVKCSGMFVSSLGYEFPVDGNCNESVTLVGNNKQWITSGFTYQGSLFDNTDEPLALTSGTGGVQRREDVIFDISGAVAVDANGQVNSSTATILPPDIPGISSSGTNFTDSGGIQGAHIQSISCNSDFGRSNVNELGHRGPYFRFIETPVEVSCDIEVITTQGDNVDALEAADSNLTDRTIKIYTRDGTFINLGTKNKLASVTYSGGDAGGDNATVTYSYTTFNDFDVTHPQDPT